ncbi:MAG: hypothetical protein R3C41_21000 [Calditrichia bacterium]
MQRLQPMLRRKARFTDAPALCCFVKFASPFAVHISHTDDGGAS